MSPGERGMSPVKENLKSHLQIEEVVKEIWHVNTTVFSWWKKIEAEASTKLRLSHSDEHNSSSVRVETTRTRGLASHTSMGPEQNQNLDRSVKQLRQEPELGGTSAFQCTRHDVEKTTTDPRCRTNEEHSQVACVRIFELTVKHIWTRIQYWPLKIYWSEISMTDLLDILINFYFSLQICRLWMPNCYAHPTLYST